MSEEKEKYVRPTWDEYFMEVARTIAKRATCDRGRSGCVIPLFALVPSCATAPALIFVGFLMMQSVSKINFADITDGIPAFITIMVMPFGYSISKGIAFGMIAYVIAKIAGKKTKEIPVVTWILAVVFIFALAIKAI